MEDWAELRSRKRVFRVKANLSPQEYRDSLDAVARITSGQTRWGSDVLNELMRTLPGVIKFLSLLAEQCGDKVSDEKRLYHLCQDTKDGVALAHAIQAIIEGNHPNFILPPEAERMTE